MTRWNMGLRWFIVLLVVFAFSSMAIVACSSGDDDDDDDDDLVDDDDDDLVDDDDDDDDIDDDDDDDDETERELFYDDGTQDAQLGCGPDPCGFFVNAFDPAIDAGTNLLRVKMMFNSAGFEGGTLPPAPYACTLVVYDATVAAGPTAGTPIYSQPITPTVWDAWDEFVLTAPLAVAGPFAVGIQETVGFQSIGMDTASSTPGFVSVDGSVPFDPTTAIGYPGCFMIRAIVLP
ncbi:MAG: hypothetical protein P9M14_07055 [Candidatus Alcyoniella australis]|nr:hypothetical protein [Candidatus Alcyoniella australis]